MSEERGGGSIDWREYGQLEQRVVFLTAEMVELKQEVKDLTLQVQTLVEIMQAAKGGWRLVLLAGSFAATIGGAITWFASHVRWAQ